MLAVTVNAMMTAAVDQCETIEQNVIDVDEVVIVAAQEYRPRATASAHDGACRF